LSYFSADFPALFGVPVAAGAALAALPALPGVSSQPAPTLARRLPLDALRFQQRVDRFGQFVDARAQAFDVGRRMDTQLAQRS
jgi:hypothetical protein